MESNVNTNFNTNYNRRTWNGDSESCWINSILQMILTGLDHVSHEVVMFSELGLQLVVSQSESLIYPQIFKTVLQNVINASNQHGVHQNILTGFQGARHFLSIISDNSTEWPDVYNLFNHATQQIIICHSCQFQSLTEVTPHFYHEMQVPPNNSKLKDFIQSSIVNEVLVPEYRCVNQCDGEKTKKVKFITRMSSSHLIIVLSRTQDNFNNNVSFTEDITIIDEEDNPLTYEFLAVVQFHENKQHYTCDVKSQADGRFYHTNDSRPPRVLDRSEVTKKGFVVLFKRRE